MKIMAWLGKLKAQISRKVRCSSKLTFKTQIQEIFQDLTYQHTIETQLRATLKQLADLTFAMDVATLITITDENGAIIYVNDTFCDISGYTRHELVGGNHALTKSGYHSKSFFQEMWDTIRSGEVWQGEIRNKNKSGAPYWVATTIVPFLNDHGKPYQYVAIRTDITERKNAELKIKHLAYHDALTGLANRSLLNKNLTEILNRSTYSQMTAVILFDLDGFKVINDSFGHYAGDTFLKMVSERLQNIVRPGETLARMGGDEFVLAIPDIHSEERLRFRCTELVEQMKEPFQIHDIDFWITMSIGAACAPQHGCTAEELVSNADLAMYSAKEEKGNGFRIFESSMLHKSLQRLEIEANLRKAIENQEFMLHYQPKIHPESGVQGFEALIRWQTPEGKLIHPGEFIPVAEQNGLIEPIGEWVLNSACHQVKKWMDMGLPPKVMAVNLSPRQFQQDNLVDTIITAIDKFQIDPKYLELEITEGLLMANPHEATKKLEQLKEVGVLIALDDFGTEFSSLYYLKKFPIDIIKIDRLFIRDIEEDSKVRTIIQSIVSLAHNLGLKVTAEGVETEGQLSFLHEISCDFVQGFYFARPQDIKTTTKLLQSELNQNAQQLFQKERKLYVVNQD